MLNITDVDGIVEKCREEHVDGVMNFCIDPAQKPYYEICRRLNVPCIGTKETFEILTDKRKFKDYCIAHDVDVIPEYTEEDIRKGNVEYPCSLSLLIAEDPVGNLFAIQKKKQ